MITSDEEKQRMLELYHKYRPECRTKKEICRKIGLEMGRSSPTVEKCLEGKVEFPPPHEVTDKIAEYIRQVHRRLLKENKGKRQGLVSQTAEITGWSDVTIRRVLRPDYQPPTPTTPPKTNYGSRAQVVVSSESREMGEREENEEESEDDEREEKAYQLVEVSEELQRKILVQHKKYSNPIEVRAQLNLRGEHCTLEQVLAVFEKYGLSMTSSGKKSSEPY